ncbi:DUF1080 domain-containing protein [Planctomycetales bacterium ZRK34]|nr:DUF1080 domain-containing protein [Planctomycetales bacterium ZRK34]
MLRYTTCLLMITAMMMLLAACASEPQCESCDVAGPADKQPAVGETIALFDGKTMGNWKSTQFGGEGEVHIEDGNLILPFGSMMTGITWKGEPPVKMNYEITVEAQRVDGNDFFCGLTFPVGDKFCSLICGGWGGGVTGLSSLDGYDASENETSTWQDYQAGKWYTIKLRVEPTRIQAWLDGKQIVDQDIENRRIGIRVEVDPSRPLGIASYGTTAAIRKIELKKLK